MQPSHSIFNRFAKDVAIPLVLSTLAVGAFCALAFLIANVVVDGIMAFSQSGQARLGRMSSAAVETLVGDLRESVLRKFLVAGLIAWLASLAWYLSLFLRPIWRAGEASSRRFLWWSFLSVVIFFVLLSFLATLIPAIAMSVGATVATDTDSTRFFGMTAFGTAGSGLAYWIATLIGTPAYARPAVLFGSLLVGSGGSKKGGE
jgi:hypothetical protein